ncbi:MAG: transketolase family protein, partial [Candidatus Nanosynbacter sp.]|nr:transketolase family protein [Candidatus Nanosynbacter sp.]
MSFLMENWQNLELAAIRVGFGEGLVDIAKKNNLVVALSADLMESVGFGKFYEEIGKPRAIEVGVAEQNLVTVASGLAAMGNIPF